MQERLSALGVDPVPELVELYSWRDPDDNPGLFWEADLVGIEAAVEVWRDHRSVVAGATEGTEPGQFSWPGPPSWFPALVGVGNSSDCLMMDCGAGPDRGGLWWIMPQDETRKVFVSLSEALRAAAYCISSGLWTHSAGFVECRRSHQPWPHDREHPPWCDQHH